MTPQQRHAQALTQLQGLGAFTQPWMRQAYTQHPRHRFAPDTVWTGAGHHYTPLHRTHQPQRWADLVYQPHQPVVTQVDDGHHNGEQGSLPSSSLSAATAVFAMLKAADIQPGHRVLEIGTGTGWNTALLAHRTGGDNVVTLEIDPQLARTATHNLTRSAPGVTVVCADGEQGHPDRAPYDRILSTASVTTIPPAWLHQTRPGAIIVTPFETLFCRRGLARLERHATGPTASGRFGDPVAFMTTRGQRAHYPISDVFTDQSWTNRRVQDLNPNDDPEWFLNHPNAHFAVGLKLPEVFCVHETDDQANRWWLCDQESWALIETGDAIYQGGPSNLYTQACDAAAWWHDQGRPGIGRFGLTAHPNGQRVWLNNPDNTV